MSERKVLNVSILYTIVFYFMLGYIKNTIDPVSSNIKLGLPLACLGTKLAYPEF